MNINYDPDIHGELLSAYLDDALDPAQKTEAENLLANSEEARRHLDALVALQNVFQQWEPAKPDAFFLRRVEAQISESKMPQHRTRSWGMRFHKYAVAAMVLLTLGGMAFLTHLKQNSDHIDVEAFLHGFLDQDVEQVVVLSDADVSNEMVLNLILTENVR
ncbi:MAG: hypothetical protein HN521_23500 [Candidatus Latescibacteria bacterium]|nr:hypothetical protein [Candidatus Latescibacterota bacterium]